jgi:putative ABC transport system permease protein
VKFLQMSEIEEALPVRLRYDIEFRNRPISLVTTVADRAYAIEKQRLTQHHDVEMLRRLADEENVVVVSENFSAHYGVRPGDTITLPSDKGEVAFRVIGAVVDYSWPLGTVMLNQRDYEKYWNDLSVTLFDVYVRRGHDPAAVKEMIRNSPELGTKYDLRPMTRTDLKAHIDEMIELLFGIAYGQLIVVMLVAGLGMVTALLISVLQRRREMGMLRAIGASQARVVFLVLTEAFLMGIIGIVLGALFSIPLQWYALQVVFLEESGYAFPVDLPWAEAGVIALLAMTIATLAGLGPAIHAVRQRIPEAIAYE